MNEERINAIAAQLGIALAAAALKRVKSPKPLGYWGTRKEYFLVAVAAGVILLVMMVFIGVIGADVLGYALAPEASMARDMLERVS